MLHSVRKTDLGFVFVFILCAVFLAWKAQYGFANNDEAYYISIPMRLCSGDAMLLHEQHVGQLFSFLMYPICKLYLLLFPAPEGIFLHFRYIYCIIQSLAGLAIYLLLRKRNALGALLASAFFMFFTPFNIMALSYNTLGIICLSLAMALLYSASDELSRAKCFFAGMFFAGAVLCCPFLLLLYATYTIIALAHAIRKRTNSVAKEAGRLAPGACVRDSLPLQWLFVSFGAAALAIAFFAFLLSRASVTKILDAIPQVMNDPHSFYGVFENLDRYFTAIVTACRYADYIVYAATGCLIILFIDRNRSRRCVYYFSFAAMLSIGFTLLLFRRFYVNFLAFPANFAGLIAYFLQKRPDRHAFLYFWVPGMAYSFLLNVGSDQEFYAISSGSSVALIGSILLICSFLGECFLDLAHKAQPRARQIGSSAMLVSGVAVLAAVFGTLITVRTLSTFWDKAVPELNTKITYGAETGIIASDEKELFYRQLYQKTGAIRNEPRGKVLYISKNTWLNLDDKKPIGAYSVWIATTYATVELLHLADYYSLCPEKTPDFIFIDPEMHDVPEAENLLISSGAYRWKGAAGERYLERVKGMAFPIDAVRSAFAVG